MQVLVVTRSSDRIERTLAAIGRRAQAIRLDVDRLATDVGFTLVQEASGSRATVRTPDGTFVLDDLRAVWLRRLAPPDLPAALPAHVQQGIQQETRAALLAWLAALPARTMDPRALRRDEERKALTLRIAAEEGLAVPRTLHTTRLDAARAFVRSCPDGAITKVLSSFPGQHEAAEPVPLPHTLTEADLDAMGDLRWCPMTLQERVIKARELRVTIVGPHILACEADTAILPGAEADLHRAGPQVAPGWRPVTLPDEVQAQLSRTMTRLGLNYGAADILVDRDGRHVLLEVNAAGEYLLYDHVYEGAISEAIAEHLVGQVGWREAVVE